MYLSKNMKNKQIILNQEEINSKINRIAVSIIEDYYQETDITIIGFEKNGYIIAQKIKNIIEKRHNINVSLHKIKTNALFEYSITPKITARKLKNVFLVDDVLKSGKTIIYGIKKILEHNTQSLKTIILVNRNHHQFPVSADYVGLNLSTTLKDHIEVVLQKEETVYLT